MNQTRYKKLLGTLLHLALLAASFLTMERAHASIRWVSPFLGQVLEYHSTFLAAKQACYSFVQSKGLPPEGYCYFAGTVKPGGQEINYWSFTIPRWIGVKEVISDGTVQAVTWTGNFIYDIVCPAGNSVDKDSGQCIPAPPKKVIVLDPGHGLSCPSIGLAAGAVGETDFAPNNPPSGRLREDDLTVAIALEAERLLSSSYKVRLTKRDVNSCLTFKERGRIANNANAKAFVSIHINKSNTILGYENPFGNGTSGLYNSSKPASKTMATEMANSVSTSLGVNNRGAEARDNLAVLKPSVTNMTAVIVEAARLSGSDETKLHSAGAATKVASGIKTAIDAVIGK